VAVIVAFAVGLVLTPFAARAATRLGVVDRPGPLKIQDRPVPYLGGVALAGAVAGPVAVARPSLLVPIGLALALGLADDVASLPARLRLLFEAGIAATAAVVVPVDDVAGAMVAFAAVLVLLNAVNLLDGLDALASGVGLVAALGFAVVLGGDARVLALALAGALGAVLLWNRPPARIYLGDAGSYTLGTTLGMLVAYGFTPGESGSHAAAVLLLAGAPVADTVVAIVRRLRAGRPLFQGDRGHVYDQLVDRGWSRNASVLACVAAQAVLALAAVGVAELQAELAVGVAAGIVVALGVALLAVFTSAGSWAEP